MKAFGHVWSRLVKAERHRSCRREKSVPEARQGTGDGASRVGGGAKSEAEFLDTSMWTRHLYARYA